MFVLCVSVHHTGTQFVQKLFEDAGYIATDKTPKEAGNSCNYFHRCHMAPSVMTELNDWLKLTDDMPLVIPLRHPVEVLQSWLVRKKQPKQLMEQWKILVDYVDIKYEPLYLPLDHDDRDHYFTNLRLKTDLGLKTNWPIVGSKREDSEHFAQLKPIALEPEHIDMMFELMAEPFFHRFYPQPWQL